MLKPYFPKCKDQPAPLKVCVERTVRFEEVDALGIVWHGRYASYFEDARIALGQKYGIGYMDFYNHGVVAPIKKMHFDYHWPLRFQEKMTIEGILHWSEAARMNFEFIIRNNNGELATTGFTVQMMLDSNENICVIPPSFYVEFCNKWKSGELER
jgi:acyl-CoA thioester hydrolase